MKIKSFYFYIFLLLGSLKAETFFVMINPAGHTKDVGRKLVESYERSITFKMAEEIKNRLESEHDIRCVLTRYPGEEIVDLQNASFANRLGIDFFLSLHIYRQESVKPKMYIYNLVFNPLADFASRVFDPYKFVPINQAHFYNIHKTVSYGLKMKNIFEQEKYKKSINCYGVFGIPVKPLVGIIAPALLIEIGICEEEQWKHLVDPIVESLVSFTII